MVNKVFRKRKQEETIAGRNITKISSKTVRNNLLLQLDKTQSPSLNRKKISRFNIDMELRSLAI